MKLPTKFPHYTKQPMRLMHTNTTNELIVQNFFLLFLSPEKPERSPVENSWRPKALDVKTFSRVISLFSLSPHHHFSLLAASPSRMSSLPVAVGEQTLSPSGYCCSYMPLVPLSQICSDVLSGEGDSNPLSFLCSCILLSEELGLIISDRLIDHNGC